MKQHSPKKYLIKTYGCASNVADSSLLAGILESLGLEKAKSLEKTDLFIVNTCSVRQKSEDKAYGLGKDLSRLETANKKPFVILAGCMVGSVRGDRRRYSFSELKKRTPWVDLYTTPEQLKEIPSLLVKEGFLDDWVLRKLNLSRVEAKKGSDNHAFVNISSGCDNFCTFCVVPYARGEETSRTKEEILEEIEVLAKNDVTKVTLCGQNVNSWGLPKDVKFKLRAGGELPPEVGEKLPFAALLEAVHELDNIHEIDFISSNPFDFTQDLIKTLKLPKISNYIHIAVQSGNNDVLRKMNRRHSIEEFIALINCIKKVKPGAEFGTDVIVGFPGETCEQFMDTVRLFENVRFSVAFISMYSPRKGTTAGGFLEDDIPLKEKKWRHKYLTEIWKSTKERDCRI